MDSEVILKSEKCEFLDQWGLRDACASKNVLTRHSIAEATVQSYYTNLDNLCTFVIFLPPLSSQVEEVKLLAEQDSSDKKWEGG